MPSLTSSAPHASSDLNALLRAVNANPRDEAPRLALLDWIQEFAPELTSELERWDAGTLTPAEWNAKFLPHYFGKFDPADFHHTLDDQLHRLHFRRGVRLSYIAPRGGAKSTWVTLAYVLRAALEGWEPYALILSDSSDQANLLLGHVKKEIEENELLRQVYADAAGEGPEWNESRVRLRNGAMIEALGTGKKVRGRRNRSERPSLIVLDDIQSNEDVTSAVKRQRDWLWVTREVIPAGDERSNFLAVGSAIHREAVAVRLGQIPGWTGETFRAIHAWPERMDLWHEFERLATNLADPIREKAARGFYARNKAEMDRGARVYWPERWPLVDLMLLRATIGHSAFDTEYQGIAGSGEGTVFPAEYFLHAGLWFDAWPVEIARRVNTLDPSKGRTDKSDHQGHVSAALGLDGTIYVDCELQREPVPAMVARALNLCERDRPHALVIEVNQGLDLLIPEFERQAQARGLVCPLQGIENYSVGKQRIERLGSYFARKQIRIRNTVGGRMLVDQLRDFPNGDHDDGPDALELAVRFLELMTGGQT